MSNNVPKLSGNYDKNIFGGKNPLGLYVPMTEDEQDALNRLLENDNIELVIHGWGLLEKPRIQFGDLRVRVDFRLTFKAPETPQPVHFFDLELRTRNEKITLFRKRMPISANGNPLMVSAGMFIDLAWDIAIDHMDPNLVKLLLPGCHGLTSTRLDKETGERTFIGNMKLTKTQENHLRVIEHNNAHARQKDAVDTIKATKEAGIEVIETEKGSVAPDTI